MNKNVMRSAAHNIAMATMNNSNALFDPKSIQRVVILGEVKSVVIVVASKALQCQQARAQAVLNTAEYDKED